MIAAPDRAGTSPTTPRRGSTPRRNRRPLLYALMIAVAIFFIAPLVFMVVLSLQPNELQIIADQQTVRAFVPRTVSLQNYRDAMAFPGMSRAIFNSTLITAVTVAIGLFLNSLCAYSLARLRWRGRNLILGLVIALMIVPFQAVAVPLLLIVNKLGWLDTYHVQIVPFIASPFFIFLFYQSFARLPKDLEDAALIDGAGRWKIYTRVVVPLSRPVFATVGILQALFTWGAFLWPLMVTRGPQVRPLPVAMQVLFSNPRVPFGDVFAFAAIMTIPVVAVFLVFQKWYVESAATWGLKG